MRILEKCTGSWPMPDMQQQIDALREAFSADTRKPFVLKASFPYGSPGAPPNTSPPSALQYRQVQERRSTVEQQSLDQQQALHQSQVSYTSHPLTPPISTSGMEPKNDPAAIQSLAMMSSAPRVQATLPTASMPVMDSSTWNPSKIFQ